MENIIPVTVPFSPLSFNSWFVIMWTSEMRRERVPKVVPFLVQFWSNLRPQNKPQHGPKIGPKNVNFGIHFWMPFFGGFGALWVPLGSPLGPLEALLGGLWTPKTCKNWCFKVFENVTFLVFGALDGPLGLILPPSWADLVPKLPKK